MSPDDIPPSTALTLEDLGAAIAALSDPDSWLGSQAEVIEAAEAETARLLAMAEKLRIEVVRR